MKSYLHQKFVKTRGNKTEIILIFMKVTIAVKYNLNSSCFLKILEGYLSFEEVGYIVNSINTVT